jgi:hypothetical protein
MGMYTEIVAAFELLADTPQIVLDVLASMCDGRLPEPKELPNHPLFDKTRKSRWQAMLNCDSYYFAGDTHSTLRYDDISETHYLTVRSNLKNYNYEIENFLDWIEPYSVPREEREDGTYFVGYWRYEENSEPTLIYLRSARSLERARR